MKHAYLGIDIGSISTKGVIIDEDNRFLASEYIWTEGNPIEAVRRLLKLLEQQFDKEHYLSLIHIYLSWTCCRSRRPPGGCSNPPPEG